MSLSTRTLAHLSLCSLVLMLTAGISTGQYAVSPPAQHRPPQIQAQAERWQADLRTLAQRMPMHHPDLFHTLPQEDFERAVDQLHEAIPTLSQNQIILGFIRLVAMTATERDGHAEVLLFQNTGFRIYPLRLYLFDDGLGVINATAPYAHSIGARIVQIGDTAIDDVYALFDPLIPRDNALTVKHVITRYILVPELLQTLGIIAHAEQGSFVLEDAAGERFTLTLSPIPPFDYVRSLGFPVGLPQQEEPLYLRHRNEGFWLTILADSQTLFVQYNAVGSVTQSGESIEEFSRRIADLVAAQPIARVVVDMRHNGGGDATTYSPLLNVLGSPTINRPGRFFTIIGRGTFSAGGNFVTELERTTDTLLVGEPTGSSPNQYGDAISLTLPFSRLIVRVPTIYWVYSDPDDPRLSHAPHLDVALSSEDFFTQRDPMLETILALPVE